MSAAASVKLTLQEKQSIEAALQHIEPHIVSRGAALMRERAVRSFRWMAEGLEAQVQGSKVYKTSIFFRGDKALPSCTCPYGIDCKHAVAAMLELRKYAGISVAAVPASPQAPAPKQKEAAPSSNSLAGQFISRHGKPLPKAALSTLQSMEPWWQNKISRVEQAVLLQTCGHAGRGYQKITLWPEELPPTTVWEFLAYIATALKLYNVALPDPLPEGVDPKLQKELVQKAHRLQAVKEWKTFMGQWQEAEQEEILPGPDRCLGPGASFARGRLCQGHSKATQGTQPQSFVW